jgi:hypothetical protein
MPRIRSVKPEAWDSPDMLALDDSGQVLFIWLITQADDAGRLRGDAAHIARRRHRKADAIEKRLQQMEAQGMIVRYQEGDRCYIALANWRDHQRVDHPSPSRLPTPPHEDSRALARIPEPSGVSAPARADRKGSRSDRKGPERIFDHARARVAGAEKENQGVTEAQQVPAAVLAQLEGYVRDGQEGAVPERYRPLIPDIRARLNGAQP